ncbi:transcriptional repressor [Patescibacteria group bacterium]|nr:transcriptional repressor [Patescibacteria group bacterium]MBU1722144.1 transcriptional repressor [Patescibacteria group bacterium]MBU1901193.1 transcriptional repressor [Patescibacteria group bacterium]
MNQYTKQLKEHGYRLTQARLRVLAVLTNSCTPLSVQEIAAQVDGVDVSSIYRALHVFEELNIAHIEQRDDERLYCLLDKPHHHIRCTNCGLTKKVPCTHMQICVDGFSQITHSFYLEGICQTCN